jgi:hypothetical protein
MTRFMRRRRLAALLIGLQLHSGLAWAFDLGVLKDAPPIPGQTSEYIYRTRPDEALIPVYLLGAVAKPGLYHVPSRTDVVGLLALAGGPISGALVDDIQIRRQNASKRSSERLRFDLDDAMGGGDSAKLTLASNDLVYVAPAKPAVSGQVLTILGIVTGVLGIIATGFLIRQGLRSE